MIASGGVYRHGQVAFTHKDDVTHREIPTDIDTSELRVTHFAYDLDGRPPGSQRDLPAWTRLRALVPPRALVGELAPARADLHGRHLLPATPKAAELIPVLVERALDLELDAVLLVPV